MCDEIRIILKMVDSRPYRSVRVVSVHPSVRQALLRLSGCRLISELLA